MSLLTICQAVADEIGISRPTSVISNAEPDVQKLLRQAQKVGNRLMKHYHWQDLRKEHTFTAVATETQTGILPSDFDRIVPETFWNRTDLVLINGPVSAVRWQGFVAHRYADEESPIWAYRGGNVLVQPTLTANHTLGFEYVSNQWCTDSVGTGQTAWAADTDLGVIDEELITAGIKYSYLTDEGLPNGVAKQEFDEYFTMLVRNDEPDRKILIAADIFSGGRHFTGTPPVNGDTSII